MNRVQDMLVNISITVIAGLAIFFAANWRPAHVPAPEPIPVPYPVPSP